MRTRRLAAAALAVSFAIPLFASGPVRAETPTCPATPSPRTLWVAPGGADFTSDGWTPQPNSFSTPWATLNVAMHRLCPGDTLYVRAGTYREDISSGVKPGTKTYPIKVLSYQHERVVLQGTLTLISANYWTIGGINVTRDPAKPVAAALVLIKNGVGWQFVNAEVWGAAGVSNIMITGTVTGQPANYRLAQNCIHDNVATTPFMNDHNIYLMPGYKSGPGIIERNIIYGAKNGANIKAAGGNSSTGAAYVTIRYNTMIRAGAGVIVGYGSHHISMVRNLVGWQLGGSSSYNAAFLGNHVSGISDIVSYTGAWWYPKVIRNTNDSTTGIRNGGHIVYVKPVWDSYSSCSGFHPADAASKAYGRYAPA